MQFNKIDRPRKQREAPPGLQIAQLIAFDSDREENHSIYVMNANGGQLKQLTEDLPLWSGCTWSPDGKQIAFAAGNFGVEGVDIFTIDVDGKNLQKVNCYG